jgi:sulfur-oxidizing protein SoxZ
MSDPAPASGWTVRVSVPSRARPGQQIEIRTLIQHPMETGFRYDHLGVPVPRDIVNALVCRFEGEEIFRADLFPSIAANPFISFFATATRSGRFDFTWTDDSGRTQSATAAIVVA